MLEIAPVFKVEQLVRLAATMVSQFDPKQCLPSSAELPDSDDTPVDDELQNLIPNLLEAILAMIWSEREDWFFGVDMGIYFNPSVPAVVPDGFLSLGVERFVGEGGRLSARKNCTKIWGSSITLFTCLMVCHAVSVSPLRFTS